MFTYEKAKQLLEENENKSIKLEHQTYLEYTPKGEIGVRFHGTYIVTILEDGGYRLSNGGWYSVTTRKRISKYSPTYLRPNGDGWVMPDGSNFVDGMVIR